MTEEEFYEKIPEWIKHEYDKWNNITALAYFCHKYESKHGVKFRLVRSRNGPSNGKESADFARLFRILAPEDYSMMDSEEKAKIRRDVYLKIYNYINWVFDYKFRRGDKSVTGTRLFLIPAMINEFERMYSAFLSKQKSLTGIERLIDWCKKEVPEIFNSHQLERVNDLKMIEKYVKMYDLNKSSAEYKVMQKAMELELL